jgi:hypothetical protein
VISIYGDVSLYFHVLRDGYARSVISYNLISLKIHMYVHSLPSLTLTALEVVGIFPRVIISQLYIRNETYEVFSSICYKTALFSISKRLCKRIAQMVSHTCVVTNNRRMLQNKATLFLFVSYK